MKQFLCPVNAFSVLSVANERFTMASNHTMKASRRYFLKSAAAYSIGFAGLQHFATNKARAGAVKAKGYGDLVKDSQKILDLPKGFSYRIIGKAGDKMSDGLITPSAPDGMAAFPTDNGLTVVIRNHEISPGAKASGGPFGGQNELFANVDQAKVYDTGKRKGPNLGGTSSIVFNTKTQKVERSYLSLAGTLRNCAGGPTPWNSWITCEETVVTRGPDCQENHGFNFEVPSSADIRLADPVPLKDMGRFNHEAVAVDPASGIVYETEDRPDGLIYRFIPNTPGKLAHGGKLQALGVGKRLVDTRNWTRQTIAVGEKRAVRWIDLEDVASQSDLLRYRGSTSGAAVFARGEGMWYSDGVIYFACTSGGQAKRGQIWKYHVSPDEGKPGEANNPGRLELFIEPNEQALVDMCDNITVAPWGDLILCEDGPGEQNLVGVTPAGAVYRFGHNAMNNSEFAGACFSPDGSTLFVNIQKSGYTFAITGPWRSRA